MTAIAWTLAVLVMFGPGALVLALWLIRRRRHRSLRARVKAWCL